MSDNIVIRVKILNKIGLHARPAARFSETCRKFKSKIIVKKNGQQANGKSLLDILKLNVVQGDEIEIEIIGEDAESAKNSMLEVINKINNGEIQ